MQNRIELYSSFSDEIVFGRIMEDITYFSEKIKKNDTLPEIAEHRVGNLQCTNTNLQESKQEDFQQGKLSKEIVDKVIEHIRMCEKECGGWRGTQTNKPEKKNVLFKRVLQKK